MKNLHFSNMCKAGFFIFLLFTGNLVYIEHSTKASYQLEKNEINYYALVIGVEKFQDVELPGEYIDDAAISFYKKLLESENWKEENVKLLLNENATKNDIKNSIINWLDEREGRNDVVLYYFTGHSWRIMLRERLQGMKGNTYSHPYDTSKNKITDIELDSWLDKLESRNIAVILDTCYSGRMLSLRQLGRTVLAAGGKYFFCPVDGDDSLQNGIFTYHLIQGLDGVADINNNGWISAEELFRYARLPVIHFSFWKQFPFFDFSRWPYLPAFIGPQVPYIYDRHIGELPIYKI